MRTLMTSCVLFAMIFAGPAMAVKIQFSESAAVQIQDEMFDLARKNAWNGVEQAYEVLLTMGSKDVRPASHVLAGIAAHLELNIDAAIERLGMAGNLGKTELRAVQMAYGKIAVQSAGAGMLAAAQMPEDPRARALVERASESLKQNGAYVGWLPVGTYKVGARTFTVAANGR